MCVLPKSGRLCLTVSLTVAASCIATAHQRWRASHVSCAWLSHAVLPRWLMITRHVHALHVLQVLLAM